MCFLFSILHTIFETYCFQRYIGEDSRERKWRRGEKTDSERRNGAGKSKSPPLLSFPQSHPSSGQINSISRLYSCSFSSHVHYLPRYFRYLSGIPDVKELLAIRMVRRGMGSWNSYLNWFCAGRTKTIPHSMVKRWIKWRDCSYTLDWELSNVSCQVGDQRLIVLRIQLLDSSFLLVFFSTRVSMHREDSMLLLFTI